MYLCILYKQESPFIAELQKVNDNHVRINLHIIIKYNILITNSMAWCGAVVGFSHKTCSEVKHQLVPLIAAGMMTARF